MVFGPADWEFWTDKTQEHSLEEFWEGVRIAPVMVMEQIARNRHCPSEVLEQLVGNVDEFWLAAAIVDNPNVTPEIIGRIATDHSDLLIRTQAIHHPRCPAHIRAMVKLGE